MPGSSMATSFPLLSTHPWTSLISPSVNDATGPAMTSACASPGISLLAASSISSTWNPSLFRPSTKTFIPRSLASEAACSPWPFEK